MPRIVDMILRQPLFRSELHSGVIFFNAFNHSAKGVHPFMQLLFLLLLTHKEKHEIICSFHKGGNLSYFCKATKKVGCMFYCLLQLPIQGLSYLEEPP